ncbi:MAG: hypothetical protein ACK4EX_10995 [Thermaurantimonas sp.]|uniref:hypothetical protein n=1 Tax=Thermaurantimonas sp. TaxID=2681568 RepID=UPI00391A8762
MCDFAGQLWPADEAGHFWRRHHDGPNNGHSGVFTGALMAAAYDYALSAMEQPGIGMAG